MMKKIFLMLFCGAMLTTLPALTLQKGTVTETASTSTSLGAQPADERKAQDSLPMAKDSMWSVFAKSKVALNEEKGTYKAEFPEEIKKLVGTKIKVSGFMLPLESTEKFKHFLLSKRTPTCPFCPPGQPTEIVEVYAANPVPWVDELVTYEGTFSLINNQEMGVFFEMKDAVQVK